MKRISKYNKNFLHSHFFFPLLKFHYNLILYTMERNSGMKLWKELLYINLTFLFQMHFIPRNFLSLLRMHEILFHTSIPVSTLNSGKN